MLRDSESGVISKILKIRVGTRVRHPAPADSTIASHTDYSHYYAPAALQIFLQPLVRVPGVFEIPNHGKLGLELGLGNRRQ